jgi:hypothetical protein
MQRPRTRIHSFFLALLIPGFLASAASDAPYILPIADGPPVQLLNDTAFTNGFRAFWSCKTFSYDNNWIANVGIGECRDYYAPYANSQGKNYSIHAWPETGPANYWSDENKFWSFNEGIHAGFTTHGFTFPLELGPGDPRNYPVLYPTQHRPFSETELLVHRLEANQESSNGVITGGLYGLSSSQIFLQSMNNLSPNDEHAGELVRTVVSNRAGEIMMYMNTQNEIRNVANANTGDFAYDTWPHFILEQNFKQLVDLATLSQVNVSANVEIPLAQILDGWTAGNFQSIDFTMGYGLRRKDNPAIVVFLGYPLYSTWGPNLEGRFSADQFGQVFYSGPVSDLGGAVQVGLSGPGVHNPSNYRNVAYELHALFNAAQDAAGHTTYAPGDPSENGRVLFLQSSFEDYYLAGFGIGWETLGYQQVQSYVKDVSVYGLPKMIFDSEVYEERGAGEPSIYKLWNDPNGPYNEGQMRAHWVKYGCHEGRVASTTFDVKVYMDRWGAVGDPTTGQSVSYYNFMPQCYNGDGTRNYECAIDHYVIYGRNAGHPGHW